MYEDVDKEHFRVFVYGKDSAKKLANSWEEYERLVGLGVWWPSKADVPQTVLVPAPVPPKPRSKPKPRKKVGKNAKR